MLRRLGFSDRQARTFNAVILFFAFIGAVQLVYWLDRTVPVTVHFRAIQTSSTRPGGQFEYTNFFTRHRYCETSVDRWFVASDSTVRLIDPLPSAMPTESLHVRQVAKASIKVPEDMPTGVSQSCFRPRWECSPIQKFWPIEGATTCIDFVVKTNALSWSLPARNEAAADSWLYLLFKYPGGSHNLDQSLHVVRRRPLRKEEHQIAERNGLAGF